MNEKELRGCLRCVYVPRADSNVARFGEDKLNERWWWRRRRWGIQERKADRHNVGRQAKRNRHEVYYSRHTVESEQRARRELRNAGGAKAKWPERRAEPSERSVRSGGERRQPDCVEAPCVSVVRTTTTSL